VFRNVSNRSLLVMIMIISRSKVLVTCSMVWNSNLCVFTTVLKVYKLKKVWMKLGVQLQLKQLGLEIVLQKVVKVSDSVCSVERYLWVVHSIVQGVMMLFLVKWNILRDRMLIFRFWVCVRFVSRVKGESLSMLGCCSLRMSSREMSS